MSMTFSPPDAVEGLKAAMRHFPSGVTVVTAGRGAARRGITATAFTSVTMEPPTILVCINRNGEAHRAIAEAGHFCVNILREDATEMAQSFAGMTARRGADQFEGFDWCETPGGAPALAKAKAVIRCELCESRDAGSHTIFIAHVAGVTVDPDSAPLLHFDRAFHRLGARQ